MCNQHRALAPSKCEAVEHNQVKGFGRPEAAARTHCRGELSHVGGKVHDRLDVECHGSLRTTEQSPLGHLREGLEGFGSLNQAEVDYLFG